MEAKKEKNRYSQEERDSLLKAYKCSGKPQKQWCEESGISLSTLRRWLKNGSKAEKITWSPVNVIRTEEENTLELQIGKVRINIGVKADMELLEKVLRTVMPLC